MPRSGVMSRSAKAAVRAAWASDGSTRQSARRHFFMGGVSRKDGPGGGGNAEHTAETFLNRQDAKAPRRQRQVPCLAPWRLGGYNFRVLSEKSHCEKSP